MTNLEHLDEGNAEVEVGQVAADQAQAKEEADRDNGAEVDAARHLDRLPTIKERRVAGEELCHDGRKSQMEGRQDHRVFCQILAPYPYATTDAVFCVCSYRNQALRGSIC